MKLFSKEPEKSIQEYISEAEKREGSIFWTYVLRRNIVKDTLRAV